MNNRIVARLDIKGPNLIKSINLEGLRVLGKPNEFARSYYKDGIDEILYMDSVASLYGRNHLASIISEAAEGIFVPITVGGGIRSVSDVKSILRAGADKVAINTAAVSRPALISEVSSEFGSQCMVASIDAKKVGNKKWEIFTDNGREPTGIDAVTWSQKCESLGSGEILLTSIDQEGTRRGFDIELLSAVTSKVKVPVIASGGMGKIEDLVEAIRFGGVDAVAMADIIHYKRSSISSIRKFAIESGLQVRPFNEV
jgi:cyclase